MLMLVVRYVSVDMTNTVIHWMFFGMQFRRNEFQDGYMFERKQFLYRKAGVVSNGK